MHWKNYLHINQQDRLSILILFLLLTIAITLTITNKAQETSTVTEQQLSEFSLQTDSAYLATYKHFPKLKDGEQININIADTLDLQRIPGVGSTLATRIIEERLRQKKYTALNQLEKIKGIKGKKFQKIKPFLKLDD